MALQEIRWWLNNAITLHRDIQHPRPSVTIQSDASKLGWGAVLGHRKQGEGGPLRKPNLTSTYCGFLCPKMLLQQNGELPHTASDRQYYGHCVH